MCRKRLTQDEFCARVHNLQPDFEITGQYVTSMSMLMVKCKKCGREWNARAKQLLRGYGCLNCTVPSRIAKLRSNTEDFTKKLSAVNLDIQVLGEYQTASTKISVACKICGCTFEARPTDLLRGEGCPACARAKLTNMLRLSPKQFENRLAKVHPDIHIVDERDNFYCGKEHSMQFRCSRGHVFVKKPEYMLKEKTGCPICNESSGEMAIRRFLDSHSIEYETQKDLQDVSISLCCLLTSIF